MHVAVPNCLSRILANIHSQVEPTDSWIVCDECLPRSLE